MIMLASLVCLAGLVETGPDMFTVDYLTPEGELLILDRLPKKDIDFFTEVIPPCGPDRYEKPVA